MESFIYNEVLAFNENAICWNSWTSFEKDDITDNKFEDIDILSGTSLSSNNSDFFIFNKSLKFDKLFIFNPIITRFNWDYDKDSNEYGDSFNPTPFRVSDHTCDNC